MVMKYNISGALEILDNIIMDAIEQRSARRQLIWYGNTTHISEYCGVGINDIINGQRIAIQIMKCDNGIYRHANRRWWNRYCRIGSNLHNPVYCCGKRKHRIARQPFMLEMQFQIGRLAARHRWNKMYKEICRFIPRQSDR